MLSSFRVASTKPGAALGRGQGWLPWQGRGRFLAPRDRGPEAGVYCLKRHLAWNRRQCFRYRLQSEDAGALHQHRVAWAQLFAQCLDRPGGVRGLAAPIDLRLWADRDQDVDTILLDRAGDLAMGLVGIVAELRHFPEYRDPPPTARALRKVLERGAHRDRVGVPRVVDQQT